MPVLVFNVALCWHNSLWTSLEDHGCWNECKCCMQVDKDDNLIKSFCPFKVYDNVQIARTCEQIFGNVKVGSMPAPWDSSENGIFIESGKGVVSENTVAGMLRLFGIGLTVRDLFWVKLGSD